MSIYGDLALNLLREDKRPKKGVEFNLDKELKKTDTYKSKYADEDYGEDDKMSTVAQGVDVVDSSQQARAERTDTKIMKIIKESKDVVSEYNAYIDCKIDTLMNHATWGNIDGAVEVSIAEAVGNLREAGFTDDEIKRYIKGTFFYTSDNPNNIKLLMNLRLKYSQHITNLLEQMLRVNYKILAMSEEEMKQRVKTLTSDDRKERINNLDDIKLALLKDNSVWRDNTLDLRKYKMGVIFFSDRKEADMVTDYARKSGKYKWDDNKAAGLDELLQKAMKYDCIIQCHGTKAPEGKDNYKSYDKRYSEESAFIFSEAESDSDDKYKSSTCDWKIEPLIKLFEREGVSKEFIDKTFYNADKLWFCQPIAIENQEYDIVDVVVADAVLHGYKKILVNCCNTNRYHINPIFTKIKGVKVMYSDFSNFIETTNNDYDELEWIIEESQYDLMDLAESYGIDYDSVSFDEFDMLYEQVIIEGALDNIKEFAKKVVKMIIAFFKKLWDLIKKAFEKIKEKFTGKKTTAKVSEPIVVHLIALENASIEKTEVNSTEQLEKLVRSNISNLQKEIKKRQDEQTKAAEELAKHTESLNSVSSDKKDDDKD